MNERIKELAKQVTRQYSPTYYTEEWASQFAKLIVKECIVMADDFECDVNQRWLVDRMKQHFGVEE
jgi:hypothetical protein